MYWAMMAIFFVFFHKWSFKEFAWHFQQDESLCNNYCKAVFSGKQKLMPLLFSNTESVCLGVWLNAMTAMLEYSNVIQLCSHQSHSH